MRLFLLASALAVLAACGGEPVGPRGDAADGEMNVRVLREEQVAGHCAEPPAFAVATSAEEWQEIARRDQGCQPGAQPSLPEVRFDEEIGVAAWWKVGSCLGYQIETTAVTRSGDTVTVTARSEEPGGVCAQALGALESFYAMPRADVDGVTTIRFVLDGEQAGTASIPA